MPGIIPFIPAIVGGIGGLFGGKKDKRNKFGGFLDEHGGVIGDAAGGLIDLFATGDEGKDKINATRLQQQIEEAAKDVQRQLLAGRMDAETAIRRLEQLEAQIEKMMASESPHFKSGGALAGRTVSNIMAEAIQTFNNEGDQVFDPNVGFTGSEGRQKRQLGSNIRDLLGGATSGFGEDSPIGGLTRSFDVGGAAERAKGLTGDIFGDRGPSDRLQGLIGEGGPDRPGEFSKGALQELSRRRVARSFKDLDEFNFNPSRNPLQDIFNEGFR